MIRILFLSDTHLGFDWPQKPRINRRRRGDDFWSNYLTALQPAFDKKVDMVIHGGDLLYRSKVPPSLITLVFDPLVRIARSGIPVFVVPGNHERSHFKSTLFDLDEKLFIFRNPSSQLTSVKNYKIAVGGFPFCRGDIRGQFKNVVQRIGLRDRSADIKILCLHHPVDGATVGPANFTFRKRLDTINPNEIPHYIDAVLAGHIHRHQIIRTKKGIPVFYPGSIERTSFAEKDEEKGYLILSIDSKFRIDHEIVRLPARPMMQLIFKFSNGNVERLLKEINQSLINIDVHSILQITIENAVRDHQKRITTQMLREMLPASVNFALRYKENLDNSSQQK